MLMQNPFRVKCGTLRSPSHVTWEPKDRTFVADISDFYDLFGRNTMPRSFVVRNIDTGIERTYTFHRTLMSPYDDDNEVYGWIYKDPAGDTEFHFLND